MNKKWTPHIIAVIALVVFIFLGIACTSSGSARETLPQTAVTTQRVEAGDTADSMEMADVGVSYIPTDAELASLLTTTPNPNTVVRPLLQTKWHQGNPFNGMFPMDGITRSATSCNRLAIAQIMKYHNYPVRPIGISGVGTNFSYDWNNMLNSYRSDERDSNENQRNAVATLLYHIYLSPHTSQNWGLILVNNFGYDRSIQVHDRIYCTDSEWESLIRRSLDAGLPVYYRGSDPTPSSHGFVVDGYDSIGRFHINMGWGGRSDGWYSLNNINPRGRGREWYNNQTIVTNIKPNARGTSAGFEMALRNFSVSKINISQNELFTVSVKLRNNSPLDIFPGGQLGAALVDGSGRIIEVIGNRNRAALNPKTSSSSVEINCFVPQTIRPGQYRLMAVIRTEGGQYRTITRSAVGEGVSNFLNVTVTAGDKMSGGHGMRLIELLVNATTVSHNERFTVRPALRTIRTDDIFPGGQVGVVLVNANGDIVSVIGTKNYKEQRTGSISAVGEITCTVPSTIRAGRYQLRIVVRPEGGEWRIVTESTGNTPTSVDFTVR